MLTPNDRIQIQNKGITPELIEMQIKSFETGFPFINLNKPAVIGDGILRFSEAEIEKYIALYDSESTTIDRLKFVPASGAATRMFKEMFSFMENPDAADNDDTESNPNSPMYLMKNIHKLACFESLVKVLKKNNLDIYELITRKDFHTITDFILSEKGLGYSQLPKGLLEFHKYADNARTSIEEHLVEGAQYAVKPDRSVDIHFTISPEHRAKIIRHISDIMPVYEKLFDVNFKITYSEQKPSTDTIAVDMENKPFREKDGSLVFRPGGHGALIENLNDIKANIVFIKNIDNVVPDKYKQETYKYKKLLGGLLLSLKKKISEYLEVLEKGNLTSDTLNTILRFAKNDLMISPELFEGNHSESDLTKLLFEKLNRPIRLCGMVKNEGEPGGGPFWVMSNNGEKSLQIVESSQVDMKNSKQKEIFSSGSHFNPVDLVCSLRNYKGENFNLLNYIDYSTGFISEKSKDGRALKAIELPGLWNGAMANWITLFVEVPVITFNPVKTINDLLREQHQ